MTQTADMSSNTFLILDQYMHYMQAVKERSALTMREYRYDLCMFFRFLKQDRKLVKPDIPFKKIPIDDIDEAFLRSITIDDLYVFLIHLSRYRRSSAATRARKTATLKSFFHYLHKKRRLIEDNPALELDTPKIAKRLPRHLTLDESQKLLQTAVDQSGPYRHRDYLILTLFLNCGLRLSELRQIDVRDIHDRTLRVIGKGDKERTIYLNDACLIAIDAWLLVRPKEGLKEPDALFISRQKNRLSNPMIQTIIKRLLFFAGIDTNKYSVHKLRHTAATLMYQHGHVDIRCLQEILGHATIATTQIYTHIDNASLQDAVNRHPLAAFTPDSPDPPQAQA